MCLLRAFSRIRITWCQSTRIGVVYRTDAEKIQETAAAQKKRTDAYVL